MDGHELVTAVPAPHVGHALAAEAELLTRLRAVGQFEGDRTVQGVDLDLVAEHRLGDIDADLQANLLALAGEVLVRLDPNLDVEVARLTALRAGLALTAEPQRRALVDTGRDGNGDRPH